MSSNIKNVMIIGAGGNAGEKILHEFQNSPFIVSALTRHDSKSSLPPSVKVIKAEYTPEGLKAAFAGQDAVVCTIGSMAVPEQEKLIDAALAAGVKHYMASEFGSDTTNPEVVKEVPFFQGKVNIVEHLKKTQDRMSWSAIINGAFFDWAIENNFFGLDPKKKTALIYDDGNGRFATTTLPTIGKAVVGALKNLPKTANRYLHVSSFVITQRELLAEYEKALGLQKGSFEETKVSSADTVRDGKEKLSKGDYSAIYPMLQANLYGENSLGDYPSRVETANELLALPKEDLAEETRKALKTVGVL